MADVRILGREVYDSHVLILYESQQKKQDGRDEIHTSKGQGKVRFIQVKDFQEEENNNVMSRHGHRIETSLEGIGHLSKEN